MIQQFTLYQTRRGDDISSHTVTVYEHELERVVDLAEKAQAASPAQCLHPADKLTAFELIEGCCVCGECGAVLKEYGPREAQALDIKPGWTRLTAALLEAEIALAIEPMTSAMETIRGEVSEHADSYDVHEWAEAVDRPESKMRDLRKARRGW